MKRALRIAVLAIFATPWLATIDDGAANEPGRPTESRHAPASRQNGGIIILATRNKLPAAVAKAPVYDVVVYGGTSAAVVAAVQVKAMGKTVVVVGPDKHLGGLSSGGLGATDIGNKRAIGGIAREFYRRLGQHDGREEAGTYNETLSGMQTMHAKFQKFQVPVKNTRVSSGQA